MRSVYTGKKLQPARSIARTRGNVRLLRPRRRWDQVSWWFSLVFAIPALLIAGDIFFGLGPDRNESRVTISVTDSTSGNVVPGGSVALGGEVQVTDSEGRATFIPPSGLTVVQVVASGFQSVYGSYGESNGLHQSVALHRVAVTAAAVQANPQSEQTSQGEQPAQAATAEPTIAVATEAATTSADSESGVVAAGVVVNADGEPIADALVA